MAAFAALADLVWACDASVIAVVFLPIGQATRAHFAAFAAGAPLAAFAGGALFAAFAGGALVAV